MPAYRYVNCCLTGVLGESDYIFGCVIDSPTEAQAVEWGHQVADAFDRQHRLQPSGHRMDFADLCRNGSVLGEENGESRGLRCKVDEIPDFAPWFADGEMECEDSSAA
jgi:hypothetical protein